ncbi:MAG: PRC-barrel domain-containing protein [Bacteroidales bacterium]|nr:PRC-barrel domain-containing protein [Bacteroidales bacterium]
MLINAKALKGYKLKGIDGEIGSVKEFYFDDRHWAIRYLVANTGSWLTGRQVLISPYALVSVNKESGYIDINLTKEQIENSPPLNSDIPVSKQFEAGYNSYYGYPLYWGGINMWGLNSDIVRDSKEWVSTAKEEKSWNSHLRSTNEVNDYQIQANDGEIGHVEDFIIDDENWAIRYLIIDTKNWWSGKMVLVAPQWIERVSWTESKVFVNLSRESIKQSPIYDVESLISRKYEIELYQHYKHRGYWYDDQITKEQPH